LKLDEHVVVLINSKVEHSLTGGEYNERRQQCHQGFEILQNNLENVESWRDVKPADVQRLKDKFSEVVYKRSLFVTQEIERTQKAAEFLKGGDLVSFGKLMFETHDGLSKLYEVSLPELDFLVEKAVAHDGIVGSRLMGGGFGGCTINIMKKEHWNMIVDDITEAYTEEFGINAEVYEVTLSDGTYEAVVG
jgi:galactokinase